MKTSHIVIIAIASVLATVILAAGAVIVVAGIKSTPTQPYNPPQSQTQAQAQSQASDRLYFNCTASEETGNYYLTVTNRNPQTVLIHDATVAFYDSNGNEIGTNNAILNGISASTSYDYTGHLYISELSGIPSACKVIQWSY